MYRLYYSPGACSLAVHVTLRELGLPFELQKVMLSENQHLSSMYKNINPKARVPTLEIEEGMYLTEAPAILFYLAGKSTDLILLPRDDLSLARALEWMVWLAVDVHGTGFKKKWRPEQFSPDPKAQISIKEDADATIDKCFSFIEGKAGNSSVWIMGNDLSIVDIYLLVFYRWGNRIGRDMVHEYPRWSQQILDLAKRPSVIKALEIEEISLWN